MGWLYRVILIIKQEHLFVFGAPQRGDLTSLPFLLEMVQNVIYSRFHGCLVSVYV